MPTHRGGGEEDTIRWRKHLSEAEKRLVKTGWHGREIDSLLKPARRLLDDPKFWKSQSDGLAAFLAPGFFKTYRLPVVFQDLVAVTGRFAVMPLLPLLTSDGSFLVLALSRNAVRLLRGTRQTIAELHPNDVPQNMEEALRTHDRDEPLTFHTRPTSGGGWGAIFEGHGVGIDDAKDDLLLYFRRIDRAIHPVLRQETAPLVLASVEYLQPIYRMANTYSHLFAEGIHGNPDRLSDQELHDRAWRLIEPFFEVEKLRAADQYRQFAGTEHASSDLSKIIAAASQGRVQTLFVARDEQAWGIFDPSTGRAELHSQESTGDVNLIELAAAQTLAHGRQVYPVTRAEIPSQAAIAAVFSRPMKKHGKTS